MGLSASLVQNCVRILKQCREFRDKNTLLPLFGIEPLPKYADALPQQVEGQKELIEVVIHRLVNNYPKENGQPLLELLIVLRDKRSVDESERVDLDELFNQVRFYFSSLPVESETTDGETEQKGSETKEFRAAIQNYQLGDQKHRTDGNSQTDAISWIAQVYEQPEEWAFRIALAVFNGSPWDTCMEAALELAEQLQSPPEISSTSDSPSVTPAPARRSPRKLLDDAGGDLESVGPFRIVKLDDAQLARTVLDYVWDEYTRRELLIEWLSSLVVSPNLDKRIRASVSTGLLMLTNFDSIRRTILFEWANKDRNSYRAAIGRALGVVAEEEQRIDEVRKLLEIWADSRNQSLRWAAARAYIYVGWRYPISKVIKQWRAIADAEELPTQTVRAGNTYGVLVNSLQMSLLDAMEKFFLSVAEMPEVRQTIFMQGLIEFKHWADDEKSAVKDDEGQAEDKSLQTTLISFGLLMFLKLARILLPSEAEINSWPPILLALVDSQEGQSPYRQCLAEMFERMLCDPAAQPTALDMLRSWVERVERDTSYEAQMRALLEDILAREGVQGELRRLLAIHLGLWSPRSRYPLHEPHPDVSHLQRAVIVVDNSESARPFWIEIKSLALELGSALAETAAPQVYGLNNGQAQTLTTLATGESNLSEHITACSLIAPVMHSLLAQEQKIDALILIGNGEVFDLADWLGHPLIDRWVIVRAGPDSLLGDASASIEEVDGDSVSAVYERLCLPASVHSSYSQTSMPVSAANGRWYIDRSGYPMIFVEPLEGYLHLFPVTKPQFERFLAAGNKYTWGDEEYGELLKQNPRLSYRATQQVKYERLFLTAVKPEEAKAFGNWLGERYGLPGEKQWLTCYDWLARQPITDPPSGLAQDALAIWQSLLAQQTRHTLLDLSLMCEGVKEWVMLEGQIEKHGGLGCPSRRFSALRRDPRKLVTLTSTEVRQQAYGFRLLKR
jgi:hypothetical protein